MLKSRVKVIWLRPKLTLFFLELTQELEFCVTSFYFWLDLELKLESWQNILEKRGKFFKLASWFIVGKLTNKLNFKVKTLVFFISC